MTAIINGIKIEGTPEEIGKLLGLQDNGRNDLINTPRINSPDIPDRTYTHPYNWWYCPPFDRYPPYYDWYGTGTEYLRRQPTCTASTTAQATSENISMTNTTTNAKINNSANPNLFDGI